MQVLELELASRALARQALRAAMEMQDEGQLIVHDAALVAGDEVIASMNPAAIAAAVPSALIGALVGALVAGPLGMLVGGIVVGTGGALIGKLADTGLPHHVLDDLRHTHRGGKYAVALLISEPQPGSAASFAMRCSHLGRSTIVPC